MKRDSKKKEIKKNLGNKPYVKRRKQTVCQMEMINHLTVGLIKKMLYKIKAIFS